MKDERKIIIRNERLRKIRNNLRQILIRAVWDEIEILTYYASLYPPPLDLPPEELAELYYLEGTKHKLFRLKSRSICQCACCSNQKNDMIYIEIHDEWYCVECYDNDRIWYPAHGSAENRYQHDYINMYYEQKEKFEKKFLNRKKKDF
jgi:hypothetical protein